VLLLLMRSCCEIRSQVPGRRFSHPFSMSCIMVYRTHHEVDYLVVNIAVAKR
jgi:hypothetical protein